MNILYLVFVSTLVNMFRDTAGTVCSDAVTDGTTVLNMCEDGNAVGDHVVIDTYGSSVYRKDGGSINCSCTSTLTGLPDGTSTTVGYGPVQSLYPPTGCGSQVIVSAKVAAFSVVSTNTYFCGVQNNTFNLVQTNDTFTVVWQSGFSGSTSGYCLSLRAGPNSSLSTKCNSLVTPLPTYPTTTPSPTSPRTTTTTTTTTVMTSLMTTYSTTADPITTITSTIGERTNDGGAITSSSKPTAITEAKTEDYNESTTPPPTSPVTVMMTSDEQPSTTTVTRPSTSALASYSNDQRYDNCCMAVWSQWKYVRFLSLTEDSQRETTTQLKEATAQSKETTSQSRETTTTTKSSITTTHSRETTTNKGTSAGATTERQNCVHQNDLQQCYPLSAVVVPLVATSLLITITVVVHFILYRKRLAIVKKAKNTGTAMTSPNSVDYDSLDLSRVEPPNVYSDTSTGHMYINTAVES